MITNFSLPICVFVQEVELPYLKVKAQPLKSTQKYREAVLSNQEVIQNYKINGHLTFKLTVSNHS